MTRVTGDVQLAKGRPTKLPPHLPFSGTTEAMQHGNSSKGCTCKLNLQILTAAHRGVGLIRHRGSEARWNELMKHTEERTVAEEQLDNKNDVKSR